MVEPWVEALRGELLLRDRAEGRGARRAEGGRARAARDSRPRRVVAGPVPPRVDGAQREEAGDWELAGFIAAQMLDHDAAYGGSHFALALVLLHQGDDAGAAREVEAARRYWSGADSELPELKQFGIESAARQWRAVKIRTGLDPGRSPEPARNCMYTRESFERQRTAMNHLENREGLLLAVVSVGLRVVSISG